MSFLWQLQSAEEVRDHFRPLIGEYHNDVPVPLQAYEPALRVFERIFVPVRDVNIPIEHIDAADNFNQPSTSSSSFRHINWPSNNNSTLRNGFILNGWSDTTMPTQNIGTVENAVPVQHIASYELEHNDDYDMNKMKNGEIGENLDSSTTESIESIGWREDGESPHNFDSIVTVDSMQSIHSMDSPNSFQTIDLDEQEEIMEESLLLEVVVSEQPKVDTVKININSGSDSE